MIKYSNLSTNTFFPEKWKIFAIKNLALFNRQNEVVILTKSLSINWKTNSNSKLYIFLVLRQQNLQEAYLFVHDLLKNPRSSSPEAEAIFSYFLNMIFEENLVIYIIINSFFKKR